MSKSILLLTIGPVQDFIAEARKTRDLAAGSHLLSSLINKARTLLEASKETTIVFPDRKIKTPPNRILALVDDEFLMKIKVTLEEELQEAFLAMAAADLGQLSIEAKMQIGSLLKIYWSAIPYVKEDYKKSYTRLDSLVGGLKQLRQISYLAEQGRKCDVDGRYNVQYYRRTVKEKNKDVQEEKLFSRKNKVLNLDAFEFATKELPPGEGLSTISMLKRVYALGREGDFPSTADFALMKTLNKLRKSGNDELKAAINCLSRSNSQFFYEDNLQPVTFEKLKAENNLGLDRIDTQEKQRIIASSARQHQPRLKLTKYYAILLFDTDNMGKLLGGNWLKEGIDLLGFQDKLSLQMSVFSTKVTALVNAESSRTVYAGGDDFLGFINLNDLLPLLGEIRALFKKIVHEKLKEYLKENQEITFSAGAAIAHYKTPLNIVLNAARASEQLAKDRKDKNALAITVLKKSGEMEQTVWPWQLESTDATYTTATFETLIKMLQAQKISNTYVAAFCRLFVPMVNEDGNLGKGTDGLYMAKIVETELKRLFLRAKMDGTEEEIIEIAEKLSTFYQADTQTPLANFTALLAITDFISRHINEVKIEA